MPNPKPDTRYHDIILVRFSTTALHHRRDGAHNKHTWQSVHVVTLCHVHFTVCCRDGRRTKGCRVCVSLSLCFYVYIISVVIYPNNTYIEYVYTTTASMVLPIQRRHLCNSNYGARRTQHSYGQVRQQDHPVQQHCTFSGYSSSCFRLQLLLQADDNGGAGVGQCCRWWQRIKLYLLTHVHHCGDVGTHTHAHTRTRTRARTRTYVGCSTPRSWCSAVSSISWPYSTTVSGSL